MATLLNGGLPWLTNSIFTTLFSENECGYPPQYFGLLTVQPLRPQVSTSPHFFSSFGSLSFPESTFPRNPLADVVELLCHILREKIDLLFLKGRKERSSFSIKSCGRGAHPVFSVVRHHPRSSPFSPVGRCDFCKSLQGRGFSFPRGTYNYDLSSPFSGNFYASVFRPSLGASFSVLLSFSPPLSSDREDRPPPPFTTSTPGRCLSFLHCLCQ